MKRCILFAGHKAGDYIDDIDIYHLEELVQLGDVWCLYDNYSLMDADRLKLTEIGVQGAMAVRHGEYDFGSWKRLFEVVGWDRIGGYDEVITLNNSVILLGSLKNFLHEFETSQAEFFASCLLDEHYTGRAMSLAEYVSDNDPMINSVMFPSIFWAFKASLVSQPFLRSFFESVSLQPSRLEVCYKYEREFSREIFRRKIPFCVFVKSVYQNAFLYTEIAFGLISLGFPYLKRKSLKAEFYQIRVMDGRVAGVARRVSSRAAQLLLSEYWYSKYPDLKFDARWYMEQYPDVLKSGMSPEDHFELVGRVEGRDASYQHKQCRISEAIVSEARGNSIFGLDEDWYELANPDLATSGLTSIEHFNRVGSAQFRAPNWKFSPHRYAREKSAQLISLSEPFDHYVAGKDDAYEIEQKKLALACSTSKRLLIFFNVARDLIGGGMLSINRFVEMAHLTPNSQDYAVVVSGVPLGAKAVNHSKFKAALPQIELRILAENTDPSDVTLFLPEVFAVEFANDLTPFEMDWLVQRESLKIVILNQNNEMMPSPLDLQSAFFPLTLDLVISTAHSRYCNQEMANSYHVPVKQLTPFLPPMRYRSFNQKEKIFLLSPDEIGHDHMGVTRQDVVAALIKELPDFHFFTIENVSLEDYLDLASKSMYSLTFGEGMDGYYIEPILSGGISFAVYNSVFFPNSFKNQFGVYSDWKALMGDIPRLVRYLTDTDYDHKSMRLSTLLGKYYSNHKSLTDLTQLIDSRVDFQKA